MPSAAERAAHREFLREYIEKLEGSTDTEPEEEDERPIHFSLKGDARKREVLVLVDDANDDRTAAGKTLIAFFPEDEEWFDQRIDSKGFCWLYLFPVEGEENRYTVEAIAQHSPVPSVEFLNALSHPREREKFRVAFIGIDEALPTRDEDGKILCISQPLSSPFPAASPRKHENDRVDAFALAMSSTSARGSETPAAPDPAPPGSSAAEASESLPGTDADLELEAKVVKMPDGRTRIAVRAKDGTNAAMWMKMFYTEIGPNGVLAHLRLRGTRIEGDTMIVHPVDLDLPHDKRDLYLERVKLVAGGEGEDGRIYLTLEPDYSGRAWVTPPPKEEPEELRPLTPTDDALPHGEPAIAALMHALEQGTIGVRVQREPTGLRVRFVDPATQTATTERLYEIDEGKPARVAVQEETPAKFPPEHPAVQRIVGLVERRSRITPDEVSAILEGRRG